MNSNTQQFADYRERTLAKKVGLIFQGYNEDGDPEFLGTNQEFGAYEMLQRHQESSKDLFEKLLAVKK